MKGHTVEQSFGDPLQLETTNESRSPTRLTFTSRDDADRAGIEVTGSQHASDVSVKAALLGIGAPHEMRGERVFRSVAYGVAGEVDLEPREEQEELVDLVDFPEPPAGVRGLGSGGADGVLGIGDGA